MNQVGVLQKTRTRRVPRFAVVLATAALLITGSLVLGGAAMAHAPEGWSQTDLLEGNTNQEVAGTLYYKVDGDTVSIHWHLDEAFQGEVTNQIVCAGEYAISPAKDRCKPGQAPDGTVFWADPIGSDDWSFEYSGDETSFQIHLSIDGSEGGHWSILANFDPPEDPGDDDSTADDSTADDSTADDSTADDSTADDSTADDSTADDSTADDSTADDSTADDSTADDDGVLADDSVADDGSTPSDDGSDGDVLGRTVTKPLAQTGPETTVLAMLGFVMLVIGSTMRFGRFGSREVYATASASQSPADMLAKALRARSRHWTCHK